VVPLRYNFRSHVSRSATEGVNSGRRSRFQTETKVYQFELFVAIQENILSFDISMHYLLLMQIGESFRNSTKELLGFILRQLMLRLREKIVVERVSTAILLNQVYFSTAFNSIYELSDDRMIQFGKYVDFPLQIPNFIRLI
jgi:hypothetical protein